MTPENIRFHAAGHLAAAALLAENGNKAGAKAVLSVVGEFASHAKVNSPPQVKKKIADNIENPDAVDIALLEKWFVDPFNTVIELSGA